MKDLPEIGKEYSWQEILEIARDHGISYVVETLENYPPPEKPFKSDGCSGGCPEEWAGHDIFPLCDKHDMSYWCGLPGDHMARLTADAELMIDIAETTGDISFAVMVFNAVRLGGGEERKKSYSWGFGRIK